MPLSEEQILEVRKAQACVKCAAQGIEESQLAILNDPFCNDCLQRIADAVLEIAAMEAETSSDHMSFTRDRTAAKRAALMIRKLKGGGGV